MGFASANRQSFLCQFSSSSNSAKVLCYTVLYSDHVRWAGNEGQKTCRMVEQQKDDLLFLLTRLLNGGNQKRVKGTVHLY